MPVQVESAISGPYTPNGVTTTFAFTFKAGSETEVGVVDQDGTALSSALFSVSLDDDEGGSVTFSTAPSADDYDELYIISDPSLTQTADFDNTGSSFNPASLTRALDRAAIRDLKQQAEIDRSIKVPFGEVGPTFPTAAERVDKYLAFGVGGEPVLATAPGSDVPVRTDLASPDADKGTKLLKHLDSGTGAVGVDLRDLLIWWGAMPFQFGAVGDGTTDDGPALQKWLNRGGELRLPEGFTFSTGQHLYANVAGTHISGGGVISTPSRIVESAPDGAPAGLLTLNADDCTVTGITVSSPSQETSPTGTQYTGILSCGHRTKVVGCTVLDFEFGIVLSAFGEYYDWFVSQNYVRVAGVGGGTPDPAGGYGEDRGDGIFGCGGRMIIANNVVVPLDDTDCRGGIFVEQLDGFAPDKTGIDNAANAVIIGNIVSAAESRLNGGGRFRRGIDCEDVDRVAIANNTVRGAAWAGIQIAPRSTGGVSVTGNVIYSDCPADNANGASWSPIRAGITFYAVASIASGVTISDNIVISATAWGHGIHVRGDSTTTDLQGLKIADNTVVALTDMGTGYHGIDFLNVTSSSTAEVVNNRIEGDWFNGVNALTGTYDIRGNTIRGLDGFSVSLASATATVTGNSFSDTTAGIEANNADIVAKDNVMDGLTGSHFSNANTSTLRAVGNVCKDGDGAVSNFGTLTVSVWRGNVGFTYLTGTATYDPASVAANSIGGASSGITVIGAKAGDRVNASFSLVTQGLVPMGAVSAADTVIASFANPTGSAVDLGSGTMTVSIERG